MLTHFEQRQPTEVIQHIKLLCLMVVIVVVYKRSKKTLKPKSNITFNTQQDQEQEKNEHHKTEVAYKK